MAMEQYTDLDSLIGLSDIHWAVIHKNAPLLENGLSNKKLEKTREMLFSGDEERDRRIFVAGDFFYPPHKIESFPLQLNFDKGSSPLHFAAAIGDIEAIDLFIKYKSNLNVKDGVGATPLHLACLYGHLEVAKLLLNPKTKINQGTKTRKSLAFYDTGSTPLHAALSSGNINLVKWLIDNGADINLKTKFGCDAYFFAARGANPEIIQLLANLGLQIPNEGKYGNFPLLEAVKQNSYETVVALLKLGSPLKEPQGQQAPIITATKNNYLEIRTILIQYGAEPLDYNGNIIYAASSNDTTYIKEYYQAKKDINVINDGTTALKRAAAHGRIEAVKLLVHLGADININSDGTALHSALANQYYEIALLFLDQNADCSLVNDNGNNVLFNTVYANSPHRINMCKRMVALGANPHAISKHGITAYSIAKDKNDTEVMALFDNVSSKDAVDLKYKAPNSSLVLENLADKYDWKAVYQELWDELVPPSGDANSLQGELLRSIGKLSDEFYRNGNINWDTNKAVYLDMIAFLKTHLLDESIALEEKELKQAFIKLTHFNVVYYEKEASPHRKISEVVVRWCAAHKVLIKV
jgi:ankyrin repeat protein